MGLFDGFRKKEKPKAESFDLPPPPSPEAPSSEVRIVNELPDVQDVHEDMPQSPPMRMQESMPMTREMAPPMQEEELVESPAMTVGRNSPTFISVDDYQQVLGSIGYIRSKLEEADELVKKLNHLKTAEEKEFESWRNQLEDVQRKLAYVEDVIFAAG